MLRTRPCVTVLVLASLVQGNLIGFSAEGEPKLDGRWKLVAVERGGKRLPEALLKQMPGELVFVEGKIRGMVGDKQVYEADFVVDRTAKPMTYEMKGGKDQRGRDVTTRGIFEIDAQGRLRKCFLAGPNAVAPKSFDTKENPQAQLVEYERVK